MTNQHKFTVRALVGSVRRNLLSALVGMALLAPLATFAQSADGPMAHVHQEMTWHSVEVEEGVRIRYGVAGVGPETMLLIHGYPETAIAWRHVTPLLVDAGSCRRARWHAF